MSSHKGKDSRTCGGRYDDIDDRRRAGQVRAPRYGKRGLVLIRKTVAETRCANGANCVAYPALGESSKLSRGNPGLTCFACEERRVISALRRSAAKESEIAGRQEANKPRSDKSKEQQEYVSREHVGVERAAYDVLERRSRSVLTCERGLHSALVSGNERPCTGGRGRLGKPQPDLPGPKQSSPMNELAGGSRIPISRFLVPVFRAPSLTSLCNFLVSVRSFLPFCIFCDWWSHIFREY